MDLKRKVRSILERPLFVVGDGVVLTEKNHSVVEDVMEIDRQVHELELRQSGILGRMSQIRRGGDDASEEEVEVELQSIRFERESLLREKVLLMDRTKKSEEQDKVKPSEI